MDTEASTQTSSSSVSPTPPDLNSPLDHASRFGMVIPNRIFVGGIDIKTNENDLRRFFSQYGLVKEVKIINDRAGVSKGYGFVTFENPEDAEKILHDASVDRLCFRDKRLNIGQAIRKQQVAMHCGYTVATPSPPQVHPASLGTMYLTPTGYPYTFHNGVAYFHNPEPNTHPSHWPASHTVSGSPVMVAQSAPRFCTPQTCYQYQGPSQCINGHVPWTYPQVEFSVPSNPNPVLYVQPSELMYHPVDPLENGCVQSAGPPVEAGVPEQAYMDYMVQPPYQICLQSPLILPQGDGVREHKFQPLRRGFANPAIHMRPRYSHGPHYGRLRKDYRPDLHTSPPPSFSPAQDVQK